MRGENSLAQGEQLPSLLTLAHELKSPLALIRQLSLTRDYYNDEQAQLALKRIELTAERSLRLVDALTQNYSTTNELTSEPIHLGRLCEEIAHELAPLCKQKQQTLQLHLPIKPQLAVGNRELVNSVVYGLCDNALNYDNSNQPVILKVARIKDHIRIGVDDHSEAVGVKLSTQIGLTPINPNLRAGGSGLGLYIASQLASRMEGKLGFLRHRAGGHMFYLDLPRSAQLNLL